MIKNNKGVTLVELLIVIVILGIIAAISIPAVGRIVENSQKDAVIADATNIRNQANLFCTQNTDSCDVILTSVDLEDYLTGIASNDYSAYREADGSWTVAILTDEFFYQGNPSVDNNRESVFVRSDLTTDITWLDTTTPGNYPTTP